ncbi:MAG TPA: hypothetical protein VL326_19960, partial [Kofleriaceae bacterium]|nr:hypothetical protein [Kofleriaceae bacterium]
EAFAVGANGVAVRYDGFSWQHDTALESLAHEKLVSVVGFSSPLELFVLGVDGQVFHFRDSWSAIPSGSMFPLVALTGVARDNVIGVGINEVWRLNGTTWTQIPNPSGPAVNFHGVWAASATDIYAVGEADLAQGMSATDGIVRRYDGSSWSTPHFIADTPLWGVGGASASDVYVAGPLTGTTSTAHFNGAWVTLMDASTMGANGTAVWASAPDDTFIAGQNGIFHFMGMWSKPSTAPMTAIHGSSRQNVIAVGPAGTIWRYAPR